MFVLSFALSCNPSDDCAMPHAEVQVRAKASQGNVTVLSHLDELLFSGSLQFKGNFVDCQNNLTKLL